MQYAADLQEFYIALAPIALIGMGMFLATLLILVVLAAAHALIDQ